MDAQIEWFDATEMKARWESAWSAWVEWLMCSFDAEHLKGSFWFRIKEQRFQTRSEWRTSNVLQILSRKSTSRAFNSLQRTSSLWPQEPCWPLLREQTFVFTSFSLEVCVEGRGGRSLSWLSKIILSTQTEALNSRLIVAESIGSPSSSRCT